MTSILFSHPTANSFNRAALVSLFEAGLLKELHTTVAWYPGNFWDWLSKMPFGQEFLRRGFDERLEPMTVQHPWRELGRLTCSRLNLRKLNRHESGPFCIDAVYRSLDLATARRLMEDPGAFTGVYAFEDGALESFRAAKELGLRRFYDLPIAYWETSQRLLGEEAERLPEWEPTLGATRDSAAKLERKAEEMELAEVVIAPSQFVSDTIPPETAKRDIIVAAFGSPDVSEGVDESRKSGKLRVLFAGSMGQRKGLADLFCAMRMLKRDDVELVVMGSMLAPLKFYRDEFGGFAYEPGRSHHKVLELMRSCDVFCLPSIIEGRALVMQEAMSQGLPLIITCNTGGADLVIDGETGFLVPIRSPESIAAKIDWFADNRDSIPAMGRSARLHAAQYTWEAYGAKVVEGVSADTRPVSMKPALRL
jgi:glycosyltransferase involved in cell wall biosynthesis